MDRSSVESHAASEAAHSKAHAVAHAKAAAPTESTAPAHAAVTHAHTTKAHAPLGVRRGKAAQENKTEQHQAKGKDRRKRVHGESGCEVVTCWSREDKWRVVIRRSADQLYLYWPSRDCS